MQARLLACVAGGLLGAVVALPINNSLGLSPAVALTGFTLVGVALGYVVSIFFDVFTASQEDESAES